MKSLHNNNKRVPRANQRTIWMECDCAYFAGMAFLHKQLFLRFHVPQTPRGIKAVIYNLLFVLAACLEERYLVVPIQRPDGWKPRRTNRWLWLLIVARGAELINK